MTTTRSVLAALALVLPSGVLAPAVAHAQMVQPLPPPAGQTLNAALGRLARDPRDLAALIDAGNAALQMGDVDAAIGFFARADQLSPNNMRVKAGLAGALVRSENPYDAIPLFAEAEKAGAVDPSLAVDRGLAYDLVGDTASAQRYYRQALAAGPSDEAERRLAISQAIAGDRRGMEVTLSPLLQRQDKGAWRARAFALAILGAPEEGVAIANQVMPADLANGIAPYLRFMPRLTAAQQAAAANLGRFPRAADVGRDDPRVALYAPPRQVAGSVGASLVPAGEPLGRKRGRSAEPRQQGQLAVAAPTRTAPPDIAPTRSDLASSSPPAAVAPAAAAPIAAPAVRAPAPAPAPAQALAAPRPAPAPVPMATAAAPTPVVTTAALTSAPARPLTAATAPTPVSTPVSAQASAPGPAARPVSPPSPTSAARSPALASSGGFDLGRMPAAAAPVTAPAPAPAPASAPTPVGFTPPAPAPVPARPATPAPKSRPRSLADAFADLAVVPKTGAAPAPGAVDVRKLAEARARAEAAKTPPKPAHPSRIWVQVGTGRDTGALGFTWRGLVKDNPALFKGQSASISDWGRTNRLLAGPFATEAAAESFLAKARKADLDAFLWTSPAGQVVDPLPAR